MHEVRGIAPEPIANQEDEIMPRRLTRREFVTTGAAAGLAAAAGPAAAFGQAPAVLTPGSSRPVVIASSNGHTFKNGGSKTCVETAFERIVYHVWPATSWGYITVVNLPDGTAWKYWRLIKRGAHRAGKRRITRLLDEY